MGEKEENDNEKNYQGIMQDENMGDDGDEAYGNDEETKDTESRSVNQIVNGKEENSEDFDDGDHKQSIREQSNEEVNLDKIHEDETQKKADKKEKVNKGCEHSIEMEKEQPNERDLEGESCQDTGIEKEETVNTESDNFVSNEKNKNFEQCDNSLDFDKDQQKENELEDKGDNIEEYIDINEEASS